MAQGLEIGALAIAVALVVLVPIVLEPDVLMSDPAKAYYPLKFEVLIGFSMALLITMLGIIVLRRDSLKVPVLIPALAFLGISALSALFSENTAYSLFGDRDHGLLSLAAGVLLFYALARVLDSPLRVRVFLAAGVTTAVLISIFGIFQKYGLDMISGWGVPWSVNLIELPFSTIGNPLFLAAYLTLMMGAATALCLKAGSSWRYRAPWLFALAIIGACWIYTDQRGPMLGVIVALPLVLWFARRRMGNLAPLMVPVVTLIGTMAAALAASAAFGNLSLSVSTMIVLVAYLALVGMVLWLSQRGTRVLRVSLVSLAILVVAGIATLAAATLSGNLAIPERAAISPVVDLSSQIRLYTWRDTVPMILDRPLLGHGPDNFEKPFMPYVSEELEADLSASGKFIPMDNAHNELIQVAATTGLLGLAAYVWIFVSYFRNAYRRGGWPVIALSGSILAYILQLQTLFSTIDTSVTFWGILGASVGMMRMHDRQQSGEPTAKMSPPEAGSAGAILTAETLSPKGSVYEALAVVSVVVVVTAIAIPTFLNQRERAAQLEREALTFGVRQTVLIYEQAKAQGDPYPEAGVYSRQDDRIGSGGIYVYYPARNVKITTATPATGEFTVEGESTTLSGTFTYSYDSVTNTYSVPP